MSWRVSDKYYSSPFVQNVGCLREKPGGNYCRELGSNSQTIIYENEAGNCLLLLLSFIAIIRRW